MIIKNKLVTFVFAIALIFGSTLFTGQAFAATTGTTTASESISAGTMSVTAPATATFSPVTLNGSAQTATGNPGTLSLQDNTGAGNGYHVSLSASQLTERTPSGGFASGTTAKNIPKGSMTLSNTGATITPNGTTSPAPTWKASSFVIDNGTAVNILSANADQGMGNYTVAMGSTSLSLALVPSTTYTDPINYPSSATPFDSTLTYTIVSGP